MSHTCCLWPSENLQVEFDGNPLPRAGERRKVDLNEKGLVADAIRFVTSVSSFCGEMKHLTTYNETCSLSCGKRHPVNYEELLSYGTALRTRI